MTVPLHSYAGSLLDIAYRLYLSVEAIEILAVVNGYNWAYHSISRVTCWLIAAISDHNCNSPQETNLYNQL